MAMPDKFPDWLRTWKSGDRFSIAAFLASRVVFYPGSGFDGQPVSFFGSRHDASCFVYVDYGIAADDLRRELADTGRPFRGYRTLELVDLREEDLTPAGWSRHIQPQGAPSMPKIPSAPYAILAVLERQELFDDSHGPARLAILFLCADGIATYDALFCQSDSRPPYAAVLQDHGFGGAYSPFGHGGCLEELAVVTDRHPQYLLIGANTEPWPGYVIVPGTLQAGGGMHGHIRQLWVRNQEPDGVTTRRPRGLPET